MDLEISALYAYACDVLVQYAYLYEYEYSKAYSTFSVLTVYLYIPVLSTR